MKTILITGSTSGIGKELAIYLVKSKHKVIICSRSPNKVNETVLEISKFGEVEGIALDLSDLNSVSKFCDDFNQKIDVLVLNAGISLVSLQWSPQGIEKTFATNHVGHMLLTERILKKINLSRVIVVSSGTHDPNSRSGAPSPFYNLQEWAHPKKFSSSIYPSTKLANALYGLNLTKRYPNILVSIYDPGFIGDTSLLGFLGIFQPLVKFLIELTISINAWWYSVPNQNSTLARSVPYLAKLVINEESPFNESGRYYSIDSPTIPSVIARDIEKQQELFEFSVNLLAEKGFKI